MKLFMASTAIRAQPEIIWSLLTNANDYPAWNSTVEKIVGRIAHGQSITVYAKATSGRAFPLTVSEFEPNHKMVWSGGLPFGLFKGRRTFTLTPSAGDAITFAMREEFSGPLAPLITRTVPDLQPAFETFAADLKRQAEKI